MFASTRSIVISTFVISLVMVLMTLRFLEADFSAFLSDLRVPEHLTTYASNCQKAWSDGGPISAMIERRLREMTPTPSKIVALKNNVVHLGEMSLKVFSIDARMGYVVQMTPSDFPNVIEKKLEKSVAEQLFARLTEEEQRDLTGTSLKPEDVIYTSRFQACEFLKLVYPTGSVQADFIEGTVSYATLDQTHTGVRILTNAHRFFAEMQAESEMHTMQWDEKYFDYRKYLWRIKRNFKNLFFELPNTSRKPLE